MKKSYFKILLCFVFISFVLMGCKNPKEGKSENNKIVLAENVSPLSTLSIIAREKGYFEELGLDIQLSKFTSGKLSLDAVLNGAADIATVAETPIMFAGFVNDDFRTFATIFESPNACKVLVRKDKVDSPLELKGKKVATFSGTNAEYFMKVFLDANNLSPDDMTVLNMQPTDMVFAISNGDIDGYFVWEPHIFNGSVRLGENARILENDSVYTTTFNLVAKSVFIEQNPELVKSFVKGVVKAEQFIQEDQEEAQKIISNYTGIHLEVLKAIWGNYIFEVSLKKSLLNYLENQADWSIETGRTNGPKPQYEKLVDKKIIESIERSRLDF